MQTSVQVATESVSPGSASSAIFGPKDKAVVEDSHPQP